MTTDHSNTVGILTDKLGKCTCTECGVELDISEYDLFERIICPNCDAEQVVPAKLGNFLLIDQLGAGGMGAVYLAQDQRLRRRVALKVMRAEYGQNTKFYADFQTEAQATARLNHANIVQVYSLGEESGQPYIVMELLDGERMDDMMEGGTRLDEALVLKICHDVTRGLAAAAEAGIIHGDIKPANILMDTKGTCKVVDFGLARFAESAAESTGEIWGTPFYIAPEKARKKPEDFRSDQYSLGATLWHALAGEPPYDGETPADVVVARFKQPVPDIRKTAFGVSERTALLLMRMMAKDPHRRYPTYDSLLADLDRARKELAAPGDGGAGQKKKSSAKWVGIGAAVLIGAGLAAFSVIKGRGQDPVKKQQEQKYYTVLRGGRPVRVAVSNLSNREKASIGIPPDAKTSKAAEIKKAGALVSMSSTKVRWLNEAADLYLKGNMLGADSRLAKILRTANPAEAAHQYTLLFQGINYILDDEYEIAKGILEGVSTVKIAQPEGAAYKELPQPLASLLIGKMPAEEFSARLKTADTWYQHLGGFVQGVDLLRQGKSDGLEGLIGPYAAQADGKPAWAYVWRKLAVPMLNESRTFNKLRTDPTAGGGVHTFTRDAFPVWGKIVKAAGITSKPAPKPAPVAKPKPAPKPVAQPAPAPLKVSPAAAADFSAAKKGFIALRPLVFGGQYPQAAAKAGGLAAQLKTPEGKALAQELSRGVKLQEDMIKWLGEQLRAKPYAGTAMQAGKPVMVFPQGLGMIAKNGSKIKVPFEKINGLDFLKMGSWYLNNGKVPPGKIGEHMLGLGLYSIQFGGNKYAGELITSAGRMDASIKTKYPKLYHMLTHTEL